jgi:dephospho-CoA kinase
MLRVGVTGGIGSGKSALSSLLAQLGAHVIDADQLARDVVAPGTVGLAQVIERFGPGLLVDGRLDRAALAEIVFSDPHALADLEAITHPKIRARFEELATQLGDDAIVVHEVPLLAERGLGAQYQCVIGVESSEDLRRERLIARGMALDEIVRRQARQFEDEQRRPHCDVIVENSGDLNALKVEVDRLWHTRLKPFELNVRQSRAAERSDVLSLVEHRPEWKEIATRVIARLSAQLGGSYTFEHIGSTSVPGLIAKEVIDIQVAVPSLDTVDDAGFLRAGFAPHPTIVGDEPRPSDPNPANWAKRYFQSCDPGAAINIHVRVAGSPGEQFAHHFAAWLRADAGARNAYAKLKRDISSQVSSVSEYARLKEAWFTEAEAPMNRWVKASK